MLRQEDYEFKVSLDYKKRPSRKNERGGRRELRDFEILELPVEQADKRK